MQFQQGIGETSKFFAFSGVVYLLSITVILVG